MSNLILIVLVFILVALLIRRKWKVFFWALGGVIISLIVGLLVFIAASQFYRCNPDTCVPLNYGIVALFSSQVGMLVWFFVRERKSRTRAK